MAAQNALPAKHSVQTRSGRIPCIRVGPRIIRYDWEEVNVALRKPLEPAKK